MKVKFFLVLAICLCVSGCGRAVATPEIAEARIAGENDAKGFHYNGLRLAI